MEAGGPLVSVVVPTHNRPRLLQEAVASVAKQTMHNWELIVVDDASTPPVDLYVDLPAPLRAVRNQTALGGAAAKAIGARAARGDWVAFLDDDDLYAPTLLEEATAALTRHPDLDVLFLSVEWFGNQAADSVNAHRASLETVLRLARPRASGRDVWSFDERLLEALLVAIPMDFQRVMVRRDVLGRVGPHRPDCLMWDCEWALRAALHGRCGLLKSRLYRQRAEGQEYFSRPGRELAQMQSAYEMTLRLYRDPPAGTSPRARALLRAAASRHAGSLAYFHSVHGPVTSSMSAWWRSQRLQPGLASPRLPIAALARAALRRWRPSA